MRPIQDSIIEAVKQIKTDFIGKLEDFTGMEIKYSSLRPSFFGSIDIRNLKLLKNEETFLKVNRIRVKFSIRELILRKKTFIHTVQIENPQINIDMARDKETFEHLSNNGFNLFSNKNKLNEIPEILQEISQYLPENVDYFIRHCNINLIDNNITYHIDDMNLNLWRTNENLYFNGKLGAQVSFKELFKKLLLFKTDIGLDAVFSNNFDNCSINISMSELTCSEQTDKNKFDLQFTVFPENISVFLKDRILSLESKSKEQKSIEAENNINYLFKYDLDTDDYYANLYFNSFFITEKIKISNQWKDAGSLLQLQITGNSSFRSEDKKIDYNVNINGISNLSNQTSNDLIIKFSGNEKSIEIENLIIRSLNSNNKNTPVLFQGKVEVQGNMEFENVKPQGSIIFDRFSFTGKENFSAVFNVSSDNNEVQIFSENIDIARTQLTDFNLLLYPSERDTGISFSSYLKNEGAIYLDAVYINKNDILSQGDGKRELEASLTFASVSLYEISEIVRPFIDYIDLTNPFYSFINSTLTTTLFDTEIFFSTDFQNIVFNAPNVMLDIDGSLGMLSISGTDRQLNLSEGLFFLNDNEVLISSNVNYSNPNELLFLVNINYLDLSWHIEGQIFDKTTLIISDPNGLNIYGNLADNVISGYIEGEDFPILLKTKAQPGVAQQGVTQTGFAQTAVTQIGAAQTGFAQPGVAQTGFADTAQIIYLNFFLNLRYNSLESWNLDLNHFTVRNQNSSADMEFIRISGTANQDGASFRDIIYNDFIGYLTGSANFSWDTDFSYIEFILNVTDGTLGGEYYDIEGAYKNEKINISAFVNNMHINRYLNETNPMLLSADALVSWDSINSFNTFINISSFNARIQTFPVNASVSLNISNDELLVQNLDFQFAELQAVLPEFKFNRLEGSTKGNASIKGNTLDNSIEGNIDLSVNFNRTDSWFDLKRAFNTFDGVLRVENFKYNNKNQDTFEFIFNGDKGAFSLSGGVKDMIRLEIDEDGIFFAGMSSPFPIHCSISGTFKNGQVDAHCNNFYIDLASVWENFVKEVPDFYISSGFITGTMDIRGPLTNPEFFGTARASSMRLHIPNYIKDDLRLVPFAITAQGYEMTFNPFVTAIGNGKGLVNGWMLFEKWVPGIIGLDIDIPRENPVPYDFNLYGFLANGTASGKLNMTIDILSSLFELQGDLLTNNAVLGLNFEDLSNEHDNESQEMYSAIELKITTGSAVEFVWPISSNPILRANPEMGTAIYISSDTRAGQYTLISDVKIRSGELYYVDRSFYIRQGSLIFRESETSFDPVFNTRAEIRDRSETGPVTISMIVENQPLLSFEPRFEASPSLTQLEIYSILGQNMSSQGFENTETAQRYLITSATDILTQVAASSEIFAQLDFLRSFERQVRLFTGLDMFTIRTKFVQNLIATGATGGFAQTSENNRGNRVGNYFDNTTVFIGKYIGQSMFIQGMLTMRYDENSDLLGGISFEPDIGIELQSPFVNIRWDFFPYHPENWYVNDNSITLSWSKSF